MLEQLSESHGTCCVAETMKEGQCRIGAPPHPRLVISGTKFQKTHDHHEKLCDYLVYWRGEDGSESIAVIELKAGAVQPSASDQLANGAALAELLCEATGKTFAAILVTRKGMHPVDIKVLAQKRIRYGGIDYPILRLNCGAKVTDASPWRAKTAKAKKS